METFMDIVDGLMTMVYIPVWLILRFLVVTARQIRYMTGVPWWLLMPGGLYMKHVTDKKSIRLHAMKKQLSQIVDKPLVPEDEQPNPISLEET